MPKTDFGEALARPFEVAELSVAGYIRSSRAFQRRRILVLAPRDPHPVIGGDRVRIHRLARELAQHHDLTLLTFCNSWRDRNKPTVADGVFNRVHRVVLPPWRSWLNAIAALPTKEPLQAAYYRSAAFRRAVEYLAPDHDAVLAHLVRTGPYASHLPGVRMLEMTDAISMNMQRVAAARLGYFDARKLVYAIEAGRLGDYERKAAANFDLVTLTSRVDEAFLFGAPAEQQSSVIVVPNGVDAPKVTPPSLSERDGQEIAFVGNLASLPNFDAAWYFARRVLPLVRARRPRAVFRIIGPVPRIAGRRLRGLPGVRLEGIWPSLEAALATARVGVCPIRIGSGIQNKVLDYFAHRLAVVCSPLGLEGIDAHAGTHLLLADSPDEWADQVVRLLDDEILSQRLADAGRALACRQYRWEDRVHPLLIRLESLFAAANSAREARSVLTVAPAFAQSSL